ncbi:hypothetical protein HYC85_010173 [Camellia sinensis]|uniref:Mannosylglycoprotein endo-beta-mannosidase n=1 Tax=Camellia sinensis TaxID=4442 RepID=A0A7J7HHQ2_CAMSI|nr:hypothetical protein HYC85_010173 [Camellia sinensis]
MAEIGNTKLDSGWLAARSTEVELTGVQLTTTHPPSSAPNSPWMEAVVPGSVLATLVKNKVVSDPFYGLENESIIDIADSGREYYTFWFFATFKCKLSRNQHVDLNFRAINYSAEVYLNGHKKVLPKGMFRRHSLDVTDILHPDGENLLAVLVHPPDHPGRIPPEGGQGGDHEIGKDVAAQYVEGWDWMIPIRDRNTGIWDEVSISVTGPVKIVDPHLVSSFFDDYKRVYLHTTTGLVNRSAWVADCSLNIQVTMELEGSIFLVEHLQTEHVSIPPGASVEYTIPKLFFYKPNLWWPNGMGKQSLYNVGISIDVKGFGVSDLWSHHFGFRKIESHIDSATGGRLFKVNGQPVFIRGGNWILSDGLLRLSKKRYKTDIKFHADMNFNMIRCWGGGLAERPEFYHYCDIYGLLLKLTDVLFCYRNAEATVKQQTYTPVVLKSPRVEIAPITQGAPERMLLAVPKVEPAKSWKDALLFPITQGAPEQKLLVVLKVTGVTKKVTLLQKVGSLKKITEDYVKASKQYATVRATARTKSFLIQANEANQFAITTFVAASTGATKNVVAQLLKKKKASAENMAIIRAIGRRVMTQTPVDGKKAPVVEKTVSAYELIVLFRAQNRSNQISVNSQEPKEHSLARQGSNKEHPLARQNKEHSLARQGSNKEHLLAQRDLNQHQLIRSKNVGIVHEEFAETQTVPSIPLWARLDMSSAPVSKRQRRRRNKALKKLELRTVATNLQEDGEVTDDDDHPAAGPVNTVQISEEIKEVEVNEKAVAEVCQTYLTYRWKLRNPQDPQTSEVSQVLLEEEQVWQEFWITGDCDGRGVPISNPDGPLDHDLFLLCAKDTVKLLRNHPSLALWVGGNEQVPPEDINTALKNELKLHPLFENSTENSNSKEDRSEVLKDPSQYLDGTRIYIQGSMWDGFANGKGDFTDGPYEIQYPESFFKDDFYEYGFNPEVGSVGMPVAATIRATMPPEGWQIPLFNKLPDGYVQEVPNPIWEYHKYIPYSKPSVVHDQILLYGTPKDLDDFCLKAQLVNYVQYRALLEGWTSRMWSKYTGVLIWKNQNPWTGLRGQFYDHLHDQTAGFYGCRSAAEPIHVQLNLATYFVEVVNTTSEELSDVAIEVSVWDLEGTCPYYKVSEKLSVPSKRTVPIFEMKYPKSKNPKPVYFLLLKLYNISDYGILSRNFYWLYPPGGDYKLLEPYKTKKLPLKIESHAFIGGSTYEIQMHVQNTSKKPDSKNLLYKNSFIERNDDSDFDMSSLEPMHSRIEEKQEGGLIQRIFNHFSSETNGLRVTEINGSEVGVAFFLHFSVHASKTDHKEGEDTRILPVHYSHNYFSLVPGEEMSVNLSFEVPPGVTPRVTLHGWNYHAGHTVY